MFKRQSEINNKRIIYLTILIVFIFLPGIIVLRLRHSKQEYKQVFVSPTSLSRKSLASVKAAAIEILSPTASPSPTLTPTPVYTGYCLRVPVLLYHHLSPWSIAKQKGQTSLDVDSNIFDQQMGFLKAQGYTFYFAQDLVNALLSKTSLQGKPIVITIDDGYDDAYTYAYPSLKKYGIKATLFVPTGLLGVSSGANSYFTWDQLKEMVGSGLLTADNHTWSHFPMGTKGPAKDQYEIKTPQDQIQQYTGRHSIIFAYPYGTNATSSIVQSELKSDGIIGAFSTIGGSIQCDSFIMSLHRLRVGSIPFPAFGIY